MSRPALGAVLALIGLLTFVLAGPVIGQPLAIVIGVVLVVVGLVLFLTGWSDRDL